MLDESLELLVDKWKKINDKRKRDEFYSKKIFPKIREIAIQRRDGYKSCDGLILPVGLSPEPLIISILTLHPKRVYFLYTKESETFLDTIVEQSDLRISQIDKDVVDDTNVSDIYQKVKFIYQKWKKEGVETLGIDISGGKKSMIGACTLAGALLGARFFYVDSNFLRDYGKPEPGSEHIEELDNPYDVFGDLEFKRAYALFQRFDYVTAGELLSNLAHKTSAPEIYLARAMLCRAYAAWDDWKISEAYNAMQECIQITERFSKVNRTTPLKDVLPVLREHLDVLSRLHKGLELSEQDLLTSHRYYQPLIGTLKASAWRYEQRGKLDVATLLWYRLIELLSQQRLARYDILTRKPDYTKLQLPPDQLKEKMKQILSTKKSKVNWDQLPRDLSLINGYALLMALDDPYVQDIKIGEIRGKVNVRNQGIFAHGFKPLGQEAYQEFKGLAEKLLSTFQSIEGSESIKDWESCEFISSL